MTGIQASLVNISLVQNHLMEDIRASKQQQPATTSISQILIDSLHIPLGTTSTPLPQPSQPSQPPSIGSPPTWGTRYSHSLSISYFPPSVLDCPQLSPLISTSTTTLRPYLPPSSFHHPQLPPFLPGPSPTFTSSKHMKIKLTGFFGNDLYSWLALAEEYMDYHGVDTTN